MKTMEIPDYIGELPNICGYDDFVDEAMNRPGPFYLPESAVDFHGIQSGFACALHMHQPLIPAGGQDLKTAAVISNLQHMMEFGSDGDRYNATVFHDCYKRLGEIIPALVADGLQPRIMLDYSGELLHGLIKMGLTDVIDALRTLTCESAYRPCVEWLGTAWGHAVAPSTPVQDFRLHVRAWQHFFGALFGAEALSRVRGFSPSEMALPNHPEVAYAFVKTLKDCGFRWVLVQEHTIENVGDGGIDPYLPHRLVARNAQGETASIIAIIKTQGSDTKLVAQMQPYYEALGHSRRNLAGPSVPPIVTQIADGENGGVMMNEFPPKYRQAMAEASGGTTASLNVSEYLEYLETLGLTEADFPAVQPIGQQRLWERFTEGAGPEALEACIQTLQQEDDRFHMEGGSWTNNISWVHGYEEVLGPMQKASALFAETILVPQVPASHPRYREALYYLMLTQTSCFRYWGQGVWTDYGRELCRRATEVLREGGGGA
jgi:hypothetical protein